MTDGPLVPLGWDERVAGLWATHAPAGATPGRVGRVDRISCLVLTAAGPVRAGARTLPAVGDWVAVGPVAAQPGHEVTAVLPRWSSLCRMAATADEAAATAQVLAADIDLVLVTAGLDRPLNDRRIDRELVIAFDSGATPVVVLTKADTHPDPEAEVGRLRARVGDVGVLVCAARDGQGVEAVRALLRPHRTAVLLGPSGSGKSTLANALLGVDAQATAAVRRGDLRGRHTTTARHLLVVPGGGVLIDTPGLRSVGLWDAAHGMALAFADVEALAGGCRFRDCGHHDEPGCAVSAAVLAGRLAAARLASYHTLSAELAAAEGRRLGWAPSTGQRGPRARLAPRRTPRRA